MHQRCRRRRSDVDGRHTAPLVSLDGGDRAFRRERPRMVSCGDTR